MFGLFWQAQPPASTLVLRGAFDSITICVYGSPVQNVVVPRPGSGYDVSRENKRRREDPVDIRDSKDSKEPEERRDAAKRRSEDSRPSMADQESRDVKRPRSKDEQRAEKDDPVDVDLVPTFPEPGEAAGHKVQQPQLLWSFADVGARIIAGERSVHHMLPIDASILGRQGAAAALRAAGTKLEAFLARPDFSGDAIQTASVRHEWLVAMEETLPSLQYGLCSLSDASMAEAVENRRRLIDWTNAALDLEGAALLGKSMNLRQLRVGVMYAKTIWLTSDSLGDELTKRGVQRRLCNLCGEDFCSTLLSILVIALDASLGTAVGLEHYLGLAVEGANEQQPLPCAAVADMLKTEDRIAPVRLVVAIETITQKAQLYEALVDFQVATDRFVGARLLVAPFLHLCSKIAVPSTSRPWTRRCIVPYNVPITISFPGSWCACRWTTGNRSPELEEQAVAALEIAGQKLATAHKLWQKEPKQFPNAAEQDKVEIEDHRFTELVTPAFVIAAMSSRRTLHYFALLSTGLVTPLAEQRATKAILSALLYLMRSKAGMLLLGHQSGATKLLFRSFTAGSMSRLDAQLTLDMCMREHASLGASSEDGAHQLAILKLNVGWLLITHVEALDVIIQLTSRSPQRAGRATDDASLLQLLFPTIQNLGQLSMKKQATTWVSVLFGAVPWLIEFLLASGATPSLDGQTDNAKVGGSSGSDAKASESTRSPSQSSKDRGQSKDSDSNRDQAGEEESLLTIARRWAVLLVLAIVQDPRSTQLVAKHGVSLANLKPKLKAINARDPQIMEALSDLQAWMAPVTSLSKQQAELTPLVALSVQIGSCPVKPTINDGGQIPTLLIALRLMCHLVDTHEGTEVFSAMHGMGMSIASSLNFVAKLLDLSIVSKPSNVSPLMFAAVPLLKLARYVIRVSFRSSAAMGNYEFFLEGFFILYHSLEQIAGGAGGADVPSAETSNLKRRATLLLEILRQMYEDALSPSERVVSQGQDFDSQFYQGVVTLPSLEALLKDTVVSASTVTGSFSLLDRCLAPLHQLHGGTAFGDAQKWRAEFLRSSVALAGRPLGKMVSAMACCTNPAARNSLRQTIALLCKSDQAIGAQILKVVLKDALAMATRPKAKEEARTDEPDSHQKKTDTGQKASVPKSVSPNMHRSAPPKAELQSMVYTGMEDCAQVVGMTRIENMQLRCYLDLLAIFMDFDFFYADMAAEADDALVLFRELLKSDGNLRILALSMYWKCLTSPVQPAGFGLEAMQAWVLADAFALAAEGRIQTRCWALRLVVRLLEQPAGFKNLLGLLNDKWDLLSDLLMSVLTGFTGSEETDGLAVLNSSMVVLVMHRLLAHHRDEDYTAAAIKNSEFVERFAEILSWRLPSQFPSTFAPLNPIATSWSSSCSAELVAP